MLEFGRVEVSCCGERVGFPVLSISGELQVSRKDLEDRCIEIWGDGVLVECAEDNEWIKRDVWDIYNA